MPSLLIILFVLFLSIIGNSVTIPKVSHERDALRSKEGVGFLLPPLIAKIVALEYKGLLSDAIFSRAHTFYGGKLIRNEALSEKEWSWIFNSMDLSTDLDPYFLDPYYFGATTLAWDADKVTEADVLLEKAMRRRTWDWTIPFYIGFNHFYFLQNNEKASEYLMEASRRPGASSMIVDLAVKLSYKANRTGNAIIFLENVLKRTDDERLRREYEKRLQALRHLFYLEQSVAFYRAKFGRNPKVLAELVERNIIKNIPADPYGGIFNIDEQGRVSSTSNFITLYTRN